MQSYSTQAHVQSLARVLLVLLSLCSSGCFADDGAISDDMCALMADPDRIEILENICLFCHEHFSHRMPNLRAHCRANCFQNVHASMCIEMIPSFSTRTRRHLRSHHAHRKHVSS